MNRFLTALLFAVFTQVSVAKDSKVKLIYSEKKNISYYDSEISDSDEYIKERCKLDIYYPENKENFATAIWFHGGGIQGGNKSVPRELKNQGIAVIAVNYRLYPKVKVPKYIEDAAASVAWVFKNIEKYGGDKSKIFITGHSAGGYLCSMVGMDKSYLEKHGVDANDIAGLIPFSGHTITHFTVRKERGISGKQPIIDAYAPLFHVRKDAPPLLLITGDRELEMLGRYEENAYMMRMMKVAGHKDTRIFELDGHNHGTMVRPSLYLLLKEIKRVLKLREAGTK